MLYEISSTAVFRKWLRSIDRSNARRVIARIERIREGNFGDHKPIDAQLFELRFFFGSGYRAYYTVHDRTVVLLLTGGDKSSQTKDIEKAKKMISAIGE